MVLDVLFLYRINGLFSKQMPRDAGEGWGEQGWHQKVAPEVKFESPGEEDEKQERKASCCLHLSKHPPPLPQQATADQKPSFKEIKNIWTRKIKRQCYVLCNPYPLEGPRLAFHNNQEKHLMQKNTPWHYF